MRGFLQILRRKPHDNEGRTRNRRQARYIHFLRGSVVVRPEYFEAQFCFPFGKGLPNAVINTVCRGIVVIIVDTIVICFGDEFLTTRRVHWCTTAIQRTMQTGCSFPLNAVVVVAVVYYQEVPRQIALRLVT